MLEYTLRARQGELREARTLVGDTLRDQGIDSDHVNAVVLVVNELIAAALECDVKTPVRLTVAPYPQLISVRLQCDRNVELRDKPFDIRERLIQHLTIAFGRRRRDDGTVDLWAEIARQHGPHGGR
jgi:hypothetical protein